MPVSTFPRAIAQDTVVRSIALRAHHTRSQLNRAEQPDTKSRLQGQLDAYVVDLMDAVRAAAARTGEHVVVTPESVRALFD